MAVTEVGTPTAPVTANGTNSPSATGTWDASQTRAAGNLLIARVQNSGGTTGGTPATPAGWALAGTVTGSSRAVTAIFWKIAAGGDAAPSFSAANSGTAATSTFSVYLTELTGQDPANPVPASLVATITDTTGNPTAVTSGNLPPGCAALGVWAIVMNVASVTTTSADSGSGWSIEQQDDSSAIRGHYAYDHNLSPAAGGVLSETMSHTNLSSFQSGVIMVVVPATAAPPYTAAQPGATWLAHFKAAQPGLDRLQILLPGNPVVVDTDAGSGTDSSIGQSATLSASDAGAGTADAGEKLALSDSDVSSLSADAGEKLALSDSDAFAGTGDVGQLALVSADTGAVSDTGAVTRLVQPELLRARPGPAWLVHFKPGRKLRPVISLPDSLVAVQVSDGDTFTDTEGSGFPTADSDTSPAAAETEQVAVLGTDSAAGADTSSTSVAASDVGTGAESAPSAVGFTPPPGALFVQPVATGPTPRSGTTFTLTVNPGVLTTPGNVLVLDCRTFTASHIISVTDSRGNLWQIDSTGFNNGSNINLASAVMGAGTFLRDGDTITITNQNTNINDGSLTPQAGVMEFSGLAVAGGFPVVRLVSVAHAFTAVPLTVATASAGAAGDLAVTAIAGGAASCQFTLTAADPASGGTWTDRSVPGTSGTGCDMATQVAAGPSGYSATWSWTGGLNGTAVLVLYAGAGTAPPALPGSETAAGDDEAVLTVLGPDTAAGADTSSTGLAGTDTGSGAESSTQGPLGTDTGSGADVFRSVLLRSADAGTAAEAQTAGSDTFPVSAGDTGLGQDIGISYVSDSDAVAAGELAFALFADADVFAGDDEEDAGGGPFLISGDDVLTAAEAGGPRRPITDTDTGSGAEAVRPFLAVSAETAAVADTEVPAQGVDVWPGIPDSAWRNGRLRVVWREGTPDEVVLAEGPPSGQLFRFQARVNGIYSLILVRDTDTGSAAEAQTPVATVSIAVLSTPVSAEIPGTPGPPGMFGYASGYPREGGSP